MFGRHTDIGSYGSDINTLILDYLTAEGYPSAADKFSKEANLKAVNNQESVILRDQIKRFIHLGNIQDAIEAINDFNPQVSTTALLPTPCYDYTSFMHHAYSLRVGDEKQYRYFSPQYEQDYMHNILNSDIVVQTVTDTL
jgi:hypothetical protein